MNFSQLKMWAGFIYASLSWCNPMYDDLIDTWGKLPNFSLSTSPSLCLSVSHLSVCLNVSIYVFKSFTQLPLVNTPSKKISSLFQCLDHLFSLSILHLFDMAYLFKNTNNSWQFEQSQ